MAACGPQRITIVNLDSQSRLTIVMRCHGARVCCSCDVCVVACPGSILMGGAGWCLRPVCAQGRIQWICEAEAEELHLDAEDAEKLLWVATPDEVIFFGIIDILTAYELRKKAEHFFTGTLMCAAVSCQPAGKCVRHYSGRYYCVVGCGSCTAHIANDGACLPGAQIRQALPGLHQLHHLRRRRAQRRRARQLRRRRAAAQRCRRRAQRTALGRLRRWLCDRVRRCGVRCVLFGGRSD
eukprot:COSAG01_NODE_2646_length_7319_cov_2.926316_6_plen_238_part_00